MILKQFKLHVLVGKLQNPNPISGAQARLSGRNKTVLIEFLGPFEPKTRLLDFRVIRITFDVMVDF